MRATLNRMFSVLQTSNKLIKDWPFWWIQEHHPTSVDLSQHLGPHKPWHAEYHAASNSPWSLSTLTTLSTSAVGSALIHLVFYLHKTPHISKYVQSVAPARPGTMLNMSSMKIIIGSLPPFLRLTSKRTENEPKIQLQAPNSKSISNCKQEVWQKFVYAWT